MTLLTREELEVQLAHKSPEWWADVQKRVGVENYYYDRSCRFGLVTVDLHAGTTPSFMACRNPKGCSGVMTSMGYPKAGKPAWLGDPTHEWYRPDSVDDDAEDGMSEHVMDGGLLLRKVEAKEDGNAPGQTD